MEQITSFRASLLQSLGGDTVEAAKVGDMLFKIWWTTRVSLVLQ